MGRWDGSVDKEGRMGRVKGGAEQYGEVGEGGGRRVVQGEQTSERRRGSECRTPTSYNTKAVDEAGAGKQQNSASMRRWQ